MKAVNWCSSRGVSAIIYCDSQSAHDSINNATNKDQLAVSVRKVLKQYSTHICLRWVKAHVGIEGNEEADKLAKEATQDLEIGYRKYPLSFAMSLLKEEMISNWNAQWQSTERGEGTKIFFKTVSDRLKCDFIPDFVLTQFLTGHGKFRAYFKDHCVRTIHPELCNCGQSQTPIHLIQDCAAMLSLTYPFHSELSHIFQHQPNTDPSLYCQNEVLELFKDLCSKIFKQLVLFEQELTT